MPVQNNVEPIDGSADLDVYTVLVIDDHQAIRREIQWSLEGLYRVDVLTASNGLEGLKMMIEHLPSLVILDLMMPVMDGFAVLERRKVIDCVRDIPVVVLTASETEDDTIVRVLLAGATDYLRKPIDAHDLKQYISARVSLARERRFAAKRERDLRHDLANPLTAVIAFAQFLQSPKTASDPEEVKRLAKQIGDSATRLRRVIEQLLNP